MSFIEHFVIGPKLSNLNGFELIKVAKRKSISPSQLLTDLLGSGDSTDRLTVN
jgi:hypothetical protein